MAVRHKQTEIKKRRLIVRHLHSKGYTAVEIAKELGCTYATIHYDLEVMELELNADRPGFIVARNQSKVREIFLSCKGRRGWKQKASDALSVGNHAVCDWVNSHPEIIQRWELTPPSGPPANWREIIAARKRKQ